VPGQLIPDGVLVTVPNPVVLTVNANNGVKVAETETGVLPMLSTHAPVPLQASPHEVNTAFAPGVSDMVTVEPCGNVALHVPGQLIPAGELVIVPEPVVVAVTVICGAGENVAITFAGAEPMLNVHAPVPEQSPLQPANTDPDAGAAENDTAVPVPMDELLHVPEVEPEVDVQLTPPLPVTLPDPVPAPVMVTWKVVGMKFAVTDFAASMVTTQAPAPEQAPLQLLNANAEEDGVGVSVTFVPLS